MLVVALSTAGALELVPGATAGPLRAADSVSVDYASPVFKGTVASGKATCRANRSVTLFRRLPGADSTIGTDRTDQRGRWSVKKRNPVGAFYVKVSSKTGCSGLTSPQKVLGVALVEVVPGGLLLTGSGDSGKLEAVGRDLRGNPIAGLPAATFTSDAAGVVSVPGGLATAQADSGTARVTAKIGTRSSAPVLVTIAEPVPGALLVSDANVVSGPTPSDSEGNTFDETVDVVLTGVGVPPVDELVAATGTKPVFGRVVASQGLTGDQAAVTLAQVALPELYPDLEMNETLDLSSAPIEVDPATADDYKVTQVGNTVTYTPRAGTLQAYRDARVPMTTPPPPFDECEVETTPDFSGSVLPWQFTVPPTFKVTQNISVPILYTASDELQRLGFEGEVKVKIEAGAGISNAFEGTIKCKDALHEIPIPAGPLPALAGLKVPVGWGFSLSGKISLAQWKATLAGEFGMTVKGGIECPPSDPENDCSLYGEIDATGDLKPTFDGPDFGDVRLEPSVSVFATAKLSGGFSRRIPVLRRLSFDAIEANLGPEIAGSFTTKTLQILDPEYASDYSMVVKGKLGLKEQVGELARSLGLGSIAGSLFSYELTLDRSPTGTLTANRKAFATGQNVRLTAALSDVRFLGVYNVAEVLLVRDHPDTGVEVIANRIPSDGQRNFSFSWTAPDGGDIDELYLFVVTGAAPIRVFALELAKATSTPPSEDYPISAGLSLNCGLRADGTPVCWGDSSGGQTTLPAGVKFRQVSVDNGAACGIRMDSALACWGFNTYGQATPPPGTFTQVAAGNNFACAVRTDQSAACWGYNSNGQATPADGTFSQLSAGGLHTCGLRTDGSVSCWGFNVYGQSTPPAGTFVQVSAGNHHSCGVRTDGSVECWGLNTSGQSSPPAGTFSQVSSGIYHSCGVQTSGALVCWGGNNWGQASAPPGTFVQVSSAGYHSCGTRTDGTAACWGSWPWGSVAPPSGTFG